MVKLSLTKEWSYREEKNKQEIYVRIPHKLPNNFITAAQAANLHNDHSGKKKIQTCSEETRPTIKSGQYRELDKVFLYAASCNFSIIPSTKKREKTKMRLLTKDNAKPHYVWATNFNVKENQSSLWPWGGRIFFFIREKSDTFWMNLNLLPPLIKVQHNKTQPHFEHQSSHC